MHHMLQRESLSAYPGMPKASDYIKLPVRVW